jgi:hypothetical protein
MIKTIVYITNNNQTFIENPSLKKMLTDHTSRVTFRLQRTGRAATFFMQTRITAGDGAWLSHCARMHFGDDWEERDRQTDRHAESVQAKEAG